MNHVPCLFEHHIDYFIATISAPQQQRVAIIEHILPRVNKHAKLEQMAITIGDIEVNHLILKLTRNLTQTSLVERQRKTHFYTLRSVSDVQLVGKNMRSKRK